MSLSLYDFLKDEVLKMANYSNKNYKGNIHSLLMHETEKSLIMIVLENSNYNLLKTANTLGISRTTLYKKIKKYNIEV